MNPGQFFVWVRGFALSEGANFRETTYVDVSHHGGEKDDETPYSAGVSQVPACTCFTRLRRSFRRASSLSHHGGTERSACACSFRGQLETHEHIYHWSHLSPHVSTGSSRTEETRRSSDITGVGLCPRLGRIQRSTNNLLEFDVNRAWGMGFPAVFRSTSYPSSTSQIKFEYGTSCVLTLLELEWDHLIVPDLNIFSSNSEIQITSSFLKRHS